MKRLISALLLGSMLFSLAACGSGAAQAATMRLVKTEGTVNVSDAEGEAVAISENLGLYSGYGAATESESYAWINLDDTKLAKMDQGSEVEITKDEKLLELSVLSGSLFFNVTEPLADDETLDIRTSTMVIGIRGTCGWVTQSSAALLEGTVTVTAGEESAVITAGEMAVLEEDGTLDVQPFAAWRIPDFVQAELEDDDELAKTILDSSGLDVQNIPPISRYSSAAMLAGQPAAIRQDGSLWAWGDPSNWGELWGMANSVAHLAQERYSTAGGPVCIMEDVIAVSSTYLDGGAGVPAMYGLVLKSDGTVWGWGDGPWDMRTTSPDFVYVTDNTAALFDGGYLVKNDSSLWQVEFYVITGTAVTHIMDDVTAICGSTVLKTDGTVWVLSDGEPEYIMDGAAAIGDFAAIKEDGTLWMWGSNQFGQLGNGYQGDETVSNVHHLYSYDTDSFFDQEITYPYQTTPIKVLDHVISICETTAVLEDGSLWAWGASPLNPSTDATVEYIYTVDLTYVGQMDILTTPQKVIASGVAAVDIGFYNTARVLMQDGTLWEYKNGDAVQVLDQVTLPGIWQAD